MKDSETVTVTVKVLQRGTVTIPDDAREALDLETGDIIEMEIRLVKKKDKDTKDNKRKKEIKEKKAAR